MSGRSYYLTDDSMQHLATLRRSTELNVVGSSLLFFLRLFLDLYENPRLSFGSLMFLLLTGLTFAYFTREWRRITSIRAYPAASVSVSCGEKDLRVTYPDQARERRIQWGEIKSVDDVDSSKVLVYQIGYRIKAAEEEIFVPFGASGFSELTEKLFHMGKLADSRNQCDASR